MSIQLLIANQWGSSRSEAWGSSGTGRGCGDGNSSGGGNLHYVCTFCLFAKPNLLKQPPCATRSFLGGTVTCACEMSHNEQCLMEDIYK